MGRRVQDGALGVDESEREEPKMYPKNGTTCTNGGLHRGTKKHRALNMDLNEPEELDTYLNKLANP